MLRRLAVLCLALFPVLAACGTQPLLSLGTHRVIVEPNADSTDPQSDIPYSVGAPAHITITLVKPDGERAVLRDNDRSPDSYAFPFSGVVDVPNSGNRQVLQNGQYKLLFEARAKDGRTAQQTVDAVIRNADPVPLTVDNLALSLTTFSPNGQGVRKLPNGTEENEDQTTLDYAVNKSADIQIWVTDSHGGSTPIHSEVARDFKPGEHTFVWDGKGPNGVPLKDGTYSIHVQASDKSGNVTEKSIPVTIVDSGTPQVQIVNAKFFPTALGINGTVNVEVTVKNTGDVPIKTLGPPPGTEYTTKMSYDDPSFNKPNNPYPPYVDTAGRWRVAVQWTSSGQYPARWGFFKDDTKELKPGQEVTVTGKITILPPQPHDVTFWASIEMGGLGFTGRYGLTNVHIGFPG